MREGWRGRGAELDASYHFHFSSASSESCCRKKLSGGGYQLTFTNVGTGACTRGARVGGTPPGGWLMGSELSCDVIRVKKVRERVVMLVMLSNAIAAME